MDEPKIVLEYIEAAYALSKKSTCRRCNQKIENKQLDYLIISIRGNIFQQNGIIFNALN
jgi:hypothetical protein